MFVCAVKMVAVIKRRLSRGGTWEDIVKLFGVRAGILLGVGVGLMGMEGVVTGLKEGAITGNSLEGSICCATQSDSFPFSSLFCSYISDSSVHPHSRWDIFTFCRSHSCPGSRPSFCTLVGCAGLVAEICTNHSFDIGRNRSECYGPC